MLHVQTFLVFVLAKYIFCEPTIYFKEEFGDDYTKRWVESTYKGSDQGKFSLSAGKYYLDAEKDKGIKTSQDAKFYGISSKIENSFSNEGKTLVIQFQVKHEQNIDCGGGYIKILGSDFDQKSFHGETPYKIMFGPDICGMTKKVHVIFNYKGQNLLIKKEISCKSDELSHLYTLIVRPDNTFEVLIDNEKTESGDLESDWDFLKPKKIKDPKASKPSDWDDNEKIDDPTDSKPEDWDKPKTVSDPKAKKPEDWDDEMDGEWEPPQIDNPDYKGDWKPRQIDNPNYKGYWIHPEIDNPEYEEDSNLYLQKDIGGLGFDLWQVRSGTIFDNILITDDPVYAKQYGEDTWRKLFDEERRQKDKQDEEDRKRAEEESKKAEEDRKKNEGDKKESDDDVSKEDDIPNEEELPKFDDEPKPTETHEEL